MQFLSKNNSLSKVCEYAREIDLSLFDEQYDIIREFNSDLSVLYDEPRVYGAKDIEYKITLPIPVIAGVDTSEIDNLSKDLGLTPHSVLNVLSYKCGVLVEGEDFKSIDLSTFVDINKNGAENAYIGAEAIVRMLTSRGIACDFDSMLISEIPVVPEVLRVMDAPTPFLCELFFLYYRVYKLRMRHPRYCVPSSPLLVHINEHRMLRERVDALLSLLAKSNISFEK